LMKMFLAVILLATSVFGQSYSVSDLNLFQTYDRAQYASVFGEQAPPFDPARPAKAWRDVSVPCVVGTSTSYTVFNSTTAKFEPLSIPSCDAGRVNLPGKYEYPKRVVAEAKAWVVSAAGVRISTVDATLLSTREEAEAVRKEIGDPTLTIEDGSLTGYFSTYYDPTETRRQWLLGNGYVGWMLRNKVGPGKWERQAAGNWAFIPDPVDTGEKAKLLPVPVRSLTASESLEVGIMGPFIRNKANEPAPIVTGGGFTEADRKMLKALYDLLFGLNPTAPAQRPLDVI